jgi:16S rRNA (adenine1518-N6/adenine1519-N6)-dimethyltransferase
MRLRKGLGQHIMLDPNINRKMADVAGVTEKDLVVEVGAGYGGLTELLAQRAGKVFSIEIDPRFEPILTEKLEAYPNAHIFIGDVLNHDLADLLATHLPHDGPLKMVSNLPYYITSPILEHFLESDLFFETMVVMVQKEVAQRITAGPGGRDYGVLSLITQFYAEINKIGNVPRTCFRPMPDVESSIVRFRCRRKTAAQGEDKDFLFRVIRAAFGKRRKMLKNALQRSRDLPFSREEIEQGLRQAQIIGERRAETLDPEEFLRLARALRDVKKM